MAYTNDVGALRNRAIQDFRRRRMGKTGLKMMLHRPEMGEANLLRQVHLLEHLVENLIFTLAMLQRAIDLDLVKYSEIHLVLLVVRVLDASIHLNAITIIKSRQSGNSGADRAP